jgi:hypothetical protein
VRETRPSRGVGVGIAFDHHTRMDLDLDLDYRDSNATDGWMDLDKTNERTLPNATD